MGRPAYPEWMSDNRVCQRCHRPLSATDPGDSGYGWDYDVLCERCAMELDDDEDYCYPEKVRALTNRA